MAPWDPSLTRRAPPRARASPSTARLPTRLGRARRLLDHGEDIRQDDLARCRGGELAEVGRPRHGLAAYENQERE